MAGKALDYLVNGQDLSWATKVKGDHWLAVKSIQTFG